MKSLELVELTFAVRLFFAFLLLLITTSSGQPVDDESSGNDADAKVVYDQKQSGKYNIRININGVTIIEMDNNGLGEDISGEEEYYYYEDDLTVKPLKLTTPSRDTTSSISLGPITPISVQSNLGLLTMNEMSETEIETTSNPAITIKPVSEFNSISDTQSYQTLSMITTQQSTISNRKFNFKPTEYLSPELTRSMELHRKSSQKIKSIITSPTIIQEKIDTNLECREHAEETDPIYTGTSKNANMFKLRVQKLKKPLSFVSTENHIRGCRINQYFDRTGNCRTHRSNSLLKKLISVISTLPFALAKDSQNE